MRVTEFYISLSLYLAVKNEFTEYFVTNRRQEVSMYVGTRVTQGASRPNGFTSVFKKNSFSYSS